MSLYAPVSRAARRPVSLHWCASSADPMAAPLIGHPMPEVDVLVVNEGVRSVVPGIPGRFIVDDDLNAPLFRSRFDGLRVLHIDCQWLFHHDMDASWSDGFP